MDLATRQLLNELATTSGFAPTTEFDRAENWPPAPPPYTRAEYQLDRTQAEQAMPQPAAMDRAAPGAGQAHNLDPTHPAHPRHALYQGCAAGVDALDRPLGRAPGERSACMKASLAELAVRHRSEEHTTEIPSLMPN